MSLLLLQAHAKINIGLDVLGKRPDGFHEIRSIFVPISLADEIIVAEASTLTVDCQPPVTGDVEDNLVMRAARLLQGCAPNVDQGAKITVVKHIPTGGGLGGGSSDAASVLRALAERWGCGCSEQDLLRHALTLGSDVPFFLKGQPALVEGRGEVVTPLDITIPWFIVVVLPGLHVSTPDAYSALQRGPYIPSPTDHVQRSAFMRSAIELLTTAQISADGHPLHNDFEDVVFARHPELASIKATLRDAGAFFASMSGSGSTMYGLFTTEEGGKAALERFKSMPAYLCHPV